MTNRLHNIPFGYVCREGAFVKDQACAEIVNEIFDAYIAGDTLKGIADELSNRRITYFGDNTAWNKNMISRILDDRRYLGNDTYPMIVSSDKFNSASNARQGRGSKQPELPTLTKTVKKMLVCEECGSTFRRVGKWRTREKWLCMGGCKCSRYLDDETIFSGIVEVMNKVISSPALLDGQRKTSSYKPTPDIIRKEKEINRLMEQKDADFKVVASTIFDLVSDKFDCCCIGEKNTVTGRLSSEYENLPRQEALDEALFKRTVEKITVDKDGYITLTFIGNSVISNKKGKEE